MGDVGHGLSLPDLVAVELSSPEQGLVVALTVVGGAVRQRLDLLRVQQRVLVWQWPVLLAPFGQGVRP